MQLRIELDDQTASRLVETAAQELRPIHWQAEMLLMRVLGTYSPPDYNTNSDEASSSTGRPSPERKA